ncbi:MAG: hypothetical protein Q8O40_11600 [Chloroflexota bacterium]|nr:hypothetical protein [Chloroflexota bacterium]
MQFPVRPPWAKFPTAVENLVAYLEGWPAFPRLPECHWMHIRTSRVLGAASAGRFPAEMAAPLVGLGMLEEERPKWREIGVKAEDVAWQRRRFKPLPQRQVDQGHGEG